MQRLAFNLELGRLVASSRQTVPYNFIIALSPQNVKLKILKFAYFDRIFRV